jgi:hypothetical protein
MNQLTVSVGGLVILFGIVTVVMRFKNPDSFKKLGAMKAKFGNSVGTLIHVVAYTIVPMIVGIVIVQAGLRGISILQLMQTR